MKKFLLALALLWSAAAGAQTLPARSVPYSGGPGTVGWIAIGPCTANQSIIWTGSPAAPGCGSSSTPGLTNTHIFVGNAGNVATDVALSGDCTIANTGAITCTKSGGVALGTAAFQNTGTSGANLGFLNGNNTYSGTSNFTGAFQISGTAQTFPASGLLVGTTDAQTLTNKSIAGSEINSGLVGATYGGTGVNNGSNTLTLGNSLTTTGSNPTTLAFGNTGNTYTFPDATDTIITAAATQTLTNKSIDGSEIASGTVPAARLAQINLAIAGNGGVGGLLPIANGGCNAATAAACAVNILPAAVRNGDVLIWNSGTSQWTTLAGNNSGTQFLQENSSGNAAWATVAGTGTVTSVIIANGPGVTAIGTCTITTSGTCTIGAPFFFSPMATLAGAL